jgi:hypothetical protein
MCSDLGQACHRSWPPVRCIGLNNTGDVAEGLIAPDDLSRQLSVWKDITLVSLIFIMRMLAYAVSVSHNPVYSNADSCTDFQ